MAGKKKVGNTKVLGIVVASGIAAVANLVISIVAARTLTDPAHYAEFLVFWSFYFAMVGVISGVQNESTRAVTAGIETPNLHGAPVFATLSVLGLAAGAIIAAASPIWRGSLLEHSSWIVVVIVVVGVVFSAGHFGMVGALSGLQEWNTYSVLYGIEALARLGLVCLAGFILHSLTATEWASVLPALVWLIFLALSPAGKKAWGTRADVTTRRFVVNCLIAMVSSGLWAVLVTGFPAILRLGAGDEDPVVLAGTILAITLTRAPIMIPLLALQGMAINRFTLDGGRHLRILGIPLALVAGIGIVGAVLMYLLGPWAVSLLYGETYRVSAWLLASLTGAAIVMAWLTLTGAATIAVKKHTFYLIGWVVAAGSAVACTALPVPLATRALLGLTVGPLLGGIVHLATLLSHRAAIGDEPASQRESSD